MTDKLKPLERNKDLREQILEAGAALLAAIPAAIAASEETEELRIARVEYEAVAEALKSVLAQDQDCM